MSDPDRLSLKVLANLRAIRASEPWPWPEMAVPRFAAISPSDFVPNSTWRLTPDGVAVIALADERDALQATADLNAAMEKMEAALVEWSSGVQYRSGSEGCVKLWYDSAIGQFCIEGEDLRTAKRDRLVPAVLWWANPRKKPERAPEHRALSERCILAEDRVAALEREQNVMREVMKIPPNLVMLPESSVEAMKELYRNEQPKTSYMAPDWAVEPEPDALGECPPMRLTQAGKAWLAERVARMSNAADARVNALDNRAREIFTAPITAEEGIERLVRERADLCKRVADSERLLTEPRVEQARLLELQDIVTRLQVSAFGYATISEADTNALQDELLAAFPDVLDWALAANLHRSLNKRVAGALGLLMMQKDPKTGDPYLPSWHDLPERVAALVQERATMERACSDYSRRETEIKRQLMVGLEVEKMNCSLEALIECAVGRHVALGMERADAAQKAKVFAKLFAMGSIETEDSWEDGWHGPGWQELFAAARRTTDNLRSATARLAELTAEVEETRLILAAEISKPEGAPSARWTSDGHNWYGARPDGGMDKIERWSNLNGDGTIKYCRGWTDIDRFGFEKEVGRFNFAREGMLAADASLASSSIGPAPTFST